MGWMGPTQDPQGLAPGETHLGHLDRVVAKDSDRGRSVFDTAKRSIHYMSLTVDMDQTGTFCGGGKIFLPSYGHRSAVRPL